VADLQMRFHGSATYDDVVRVETRCAEVRSRTVTFEYLVVHAASGARLVSVSTRLVSVDRDGRTIVMPPEVRALLERAMHDDAVGATP
jgi:acyl-CoA thioesterase FadM